MLDILQQRDLLLQAEVSETTMKETNQTMTRRDYIVGELVNTERKYVQDLETLQGFKKLVEEKGEVAGDTIHAIFLNLNALLDFQRRFLIRIETMNSLPDHQQNWGQLFTQYHDAFRVYEPYIANQQNAEEHATRDFEKMQKVGHRITNDRATLSGFIMKPFQRLSKYPLLLKVRRSSQLPSESYFVRLFLSVSSVKVGTPNCFVCLLLILPSCAVGTTRSNGRHGIPQAGADHWNRIRRLGPPPGQCRHRTPTPAVGRRRTSLPGRGLEKSRYPAVRGTPTIWHLHRRERRRPE